MPLREVVVAAGQRNASALGYHVGDREALIGAILDFRRAAVDARRVRLLDAYAASGVEMNETAIAAGITVPLVELMLSDPRGGNYLRFLSQAYVTERPASAYRATGETDQGMRRCHTLYRARHPASRRASSLNASPPAAVARSMRLPTGSVTPRCRAATFRAAAWPRSALT